MLLEERHIIQIRTTFGKMQSRHDLLNLLNYVKQLVHGQKAVPFELKQLHWHANPNLGKRRYNSFTIKKRSGGDRTIYAPKKGLKSLQRMLALILQCVFEPAKEATGFTKGRSIVDNARLHEGSHYVYNIDLKDFFSSIDQARVWKCLQLKPFHLSAEKFTDPKGPGLANLIASICCSELEVERKNDKDEWALVRLNVLPQGAPTSPILSNIVCQQLDYFLSAAARRFGLKYSRYADDITFSSMHNAYQENGEFIKELHRIITHQRFHINENKTRLQRAQHRQEVTGLIVNAKTNVPGRYIKQLRQWLYYWETYGQDKAEVFFRQKYLAEKPNIGNGNPHMSNVIGGKLDYLKMVKGVENRTYIGLKRRYAQLAKKPERPAALPSPPHGKPARHTGKPIPIIHHPRELVGYLKNFSARSNVLKYATHGWDAGKDEQTFDNLKQFLAKAKASYKEFSPGLTTLSKNLNGKIYGFLFNKKIGNKTWGEHRIKFGWSSPELLAACSGEQPVRPEDFVIPPQYQDFINGKTIQKFKHVIDVFKNEIEIRDDDDVLPQLILSKHDKYLNDFPQPVLHNLSNKTFYTDVQWLSKSLDLIFESIQKRVKTEVCYSMVEEGPDQYTLEILHKGSFNTGKSIEDEKLSATKGDFSILAKWLLNLCDWSVESEFREGPYRINYLSAKTGTAPYEKIKNAEGFKYRLTFYK